MVSFGAAKMQACVPLGAMGHALEREMSRDGSLSSDILSSLGCTEQSPRQAPPYLASKKQAQPLHYLPQLRPPIQCPSSSHSSNSDVCSASISLCPSSSHSSNTTHEMEDEESHCDCRSNNDQLILPDNHSDKSVRTTRKREKYGTRTPQVGRRTNRRQDHRVDISDDENEKKMEGRRSYVSGLAAFSVVWTFFLVPYWLLYCPSTIRNISKTWNDVLNIGCVLLIPTVGLVAAHALQFKDGKLPDSAGFKLLQIMQAVVFICLVVGTIIPLHVCKCMPYSVVWTCAAGALFIIVISWSLAFQHKTVIKYIKAPYQMVIKGTKASCQMVMKFRNIMYDKVQQWLSDLILPECIKTKFKKMPEEKSDSGVPMELV